MSDAVVDDANSMVALVRSEPRFARWVAAESVTMVGTAVSAVVLPLLVFDLSGSASLTGAVFALQALPYLVFGLIAGPVADRGDRRRLIIGGNVLEGLLVATIPVAAVFDVLSVVHVMVVAVLAAIVSVFSDAAIFGAVPALVGPRRLAAANGLLGAMWSGTQVLGPVLAGVAIATVGPESSLALDAASFLIAAAVQSTISSDFRPPGATVVRVAIRTQIVTAFRFIRDRTVILTLLVVGFGNSFGFGIVLGLLVPYAVDSLGIPQDDVRIGVLYAALGVGSMVSGIVLSRLFTPRRVRILSPGSLLMAALAAGALALVGAWVVAAVLTVAFSFAITTTIATGITYRQLATPDNLRSSVNVIGRMVAWGGQPAGAITAALLVGAVSIRTMYAIAAAIMLASAAVAAIRLFPVDTSIESTDSG